MAKKRAATSVDPEKRDDPVLDAVDALVEAIEANSARNRMMIERANNLKRLRREGKPYAAIVSQQQRPLMVELIRLNLDSLADAGSRLRRLEARALHDEGLTMDEIAELFGVTRQRVSALLRAVRD